MQKPTFLKPSTCICGAAAIFTATIFMSPAQARQSASSPAPQSQGSGAAQDSSATSTPAKTSPEAKPAAKAPAKKATASTASKADAGKTSSGSTPAASAEQASAAPAGRAGTTKTGQAGATKAGASKTATAKAATALTLNTDKAKQSYAIGINVGKGLSQNLKQTGVDIDPAILMRGIKDVLSGDKQAMTDQEAQETLKTLQADLQKTQQLKQQQVADANKKEGEEFLATNKSKEGVTTLPDGLQYKILQEGSGPKPATGDSVTVNYRGTLLNGTEFDSSYKRNQPATFNVGGIIKGWNEALQLMPVGSKWQLFIPSDLAYGPRGAGRDIGPNACLVFEVELLSIQPKPAAPTPAPAAAAAPAPHAAPAGNAPPPTPTPKPQTP